MVGDIPIGIFIHVGWLGSNLGTSLLETLDPNFEPSSMKIWEA